MKKSALKIKDSPNAEEIEAEFFNALKSKPSKPKSSYKRLNDIDNDNKENVNVSEKIHVNLSKKTGRKALAKESEEKKLEEESKIEQDKKSDSELPVKKVVEVKKKKEKKPLEFTEILESKYVPSVFLYRDKEKNDILGFLYNCIKKQKYDSILISGNPGTGKTMTITHVLKKLEDLGPDYLSEYIKEKENNEEVELPKQIKTLKFNAMNYKNPIDIIVDIMSSLKYDDKASKGSTATRLTIDKLKKCIQSQPKDQLIVMFIDEIDNLFNRTSVAAEMLELLKIPKYPNSNLILIGASNTIDLIVKLNKEYKVSNEIRNVVFQPYTYDEIFSILKDRIYNTEGLQDKGKSFEEMAIRFCAKKIYSLKGGDIRYVLEIVKKVYSQASQAAEPEAKKELTHVPAEEEDTKDTLDLQNLASCPKITLKDMMKVFEELYGRNIDIIMNSMPQSEQIGLMALCLILTKKNAVLITKGDFLSAYNNICSTNYIPKIDMSTLEDILQTYESYEFIRCKTKKKVALSLGKSPHKPLGKNVKDEIIPVITADDIKSAYEESDFFSRYLE